MPRIQDPLNFVQPGAADHTPPPPTAAVPPSHAMLGPCRRHGLYTALSPKSHPARSRHVLGRKPITSIPPHPTPKPSQSPLPTAPPCPSKPPPAPLALLLHDASAPSHYR